MIEKLRIIIFKIKLPENAHNRTRDRRLHFCDVPDSTLALDRPKIKGQGYCILYCCHWLTSTNHKLIIGVSRNRVCGENSCFAEAWVLPVLFLYLWLCCRLHSNLSE